MAKFISDLKRYKKYMIYATKANLKSDVAASYLNWLWWILDPLLFMLVYTFVSLVVFGKSEQYFPIFIFIGLNSWNFFNHCVVKSTRLVRSYKGVLSRIYLPKYVLILISIMENLFEMFISFLLVFVMMPFYRVPLSWNVLNIVPLFLTLIVITFGVSCIVLHFGVYFDDLRNIITVLLRLVFYFTGIFYSIRKRIPKPYSSWLLHLNPIAFIVEGLRDSLLYSETVQYWYLGILFFVGCVLSYVGIRLIQKYENGYVKVI